MLEAYTEGTVISLTLQTISFPSLWHKTVGSRTAGKTSPLTTGVTFWSLKSRNTLMLQSRWYWYKLKGFRCSFLRINQPAMTMSSWRTEPNSPWLTDKSFEAQGNGLWLCLNSVVMAQPNRDLFIPLYALNILKYTLRCISPQHTYMHVSKNTS